MNGSFEDRLSCWKKLRNAVENSHAPCDLAIEFWENIPLSRRNLDPYDQDTWPDPWEMIEENEYCDFTKLLAVAYTLVFTERFKNSTPIFKIALDKVNHRLYYILCVDNFIVGYDDDKGMILLEKEPCSLHIQKIITLSKRY